MRRKPLSLKVNPSTFAEIEKFAQENTRTPCNVGYVLVEWAWKQLKIAGSIERLVKQNISPK